MKITVFSHSAFNTVLLPDKCAGQYWITAKGPDGNPVKIVAVEGIRPTDENPNGQWILKSNSHFYIVNQNQEKILKLDLQLRSLYVIRSADGYFEYRLFTEPLSEDRKQYRVYELMQGNLKLEIGRSPECDIQYASGYIGKNHATIQVASQKMGVIDNNSLNRTYVNGTAIKQSPLKTGDVIYAMGLQIVVTGRFLYINNPDGAVTVHSRLLQEHHESGYHLDPSSAVSSFEEVNDSEDFYYRAPRFKHDVDPFELKLDAPPSGHSGENTPLLMSIGPSITMGLASATTATFSVVNAITSGNVGSAIPSLVMSMSMLAGTLLWPSLTKSYQRKQQAKKEQARQLSYSNYLQMMEQKIAAEINNQEMILRENDALTIDYLKRINTQPLHIWERTPKHSDFLRLRLGVGSLPLNANIQYSERRFAVEHDNLMEAMYQFGEQKRWLNNVPICLSLRERFISGIYSNHQQLLHYAKSLLLQLTVLHSYDEVKLVVLYNEKDEADLSFVRWLPHTMDNERRIRYIASNPEEVKNLSADMETIIEYRKSLNADQLADELPYYVVICLDKKLASRAEFIRSILNNKENLGISVLSMYERLKDLPKECSAVIQLNKQAGGSLTLLNDVSELPLPFQVDLPNTIDMKRVTDILANTKLDINDSSFQLPKKYTFMEMMDVGMVEHLNLLENWTANDPTKSLAAPIGVDPYGDPFLLDLHEKAHGPHGLIAGMTGSGKSETIIAYILSMAIQYHPSEVAFILIDYKGGGMAKAFENIPHTAGIITNLDGNAINRSLVSMQSELHRRELIFQKVSKQYNISNIDIYKYQKLYREGKVSEPLPHLIIISDEFAELKKDQPDFMAALTSTARVGRSLGVHLILATQKPGGVVDDQIRSNSRFRLCLKVQDRGDSTEMMGRPEAASLVETGRFYLQVGNNELFELGQSAWAGAFYHPAPNVVKELDDAISVINANGRVIAEVNTDRYAGHKDARKQLDVITEYISKISDEEHIQRWKMWLEPLPAKIFVDDLAKKYSVSSAGSYELNPIVGEYDDPRHQAQGLLRVPLSADGNVIVYGSAGSGKTMFIEAMCYSLMTEHSPEEVNLYILDLGSETLTSFADAPHVGDVILSHESEKVENLFKLLQGKLNTRKKLLAQYGGSLAQYNASAAKPEPNIVVFINNYAGFGELFEERMGDINYLTREGTKYGIYFVLTCTGVNNVRFSMMQNFKCLYCLQMNNSSDYANVVGKTDGLFPEKHVGRGMLRTDSGTVVEFQTAHITDDAASYQFLRSFCKNMAARYSSVQAAAVPVLPEHVTLEYLRRYITPGDISKIPVGVEKESLEIAHFNPLTQPVHLVLSQNQEWHAFTESLAIMLADAYRINTLLLAPGGYSKALSESSPLKVYEKREDCVQAVHEIFQQVLVRNNSYKEALAAGKELPTFEPLFVIVQSLAQLKSLLDSHVTTNAQASDDTPMNRLRIAMEKCSKDYGVYFIVAENIQTLTPFTAESWYKAQINPNHGIWLGNGIGSQYRLNVNAKPQGFNSSLDQNFGFCVRNAAAVLVKFLE